MRAHFMCSSAILVVALLAGPDGALAQSEPPSARSTTGLAPADRPYNIDNPSLAGQAIPSPQDAAIHNRDVALRDGLPTIAYTFNFTPEQKKLIRDALVAEKSAKDPGFPISASSEIPESIALTRVPDSIGQKMPWVKPYKYVKLGDKIVIVDPNLPLVVTVIE